MELGTYHTVKIAELDLSYRHDIFFRRYVIENMEQLAYDQYMRNVDAYKPPSRRRTFDGFMQLVASVKENGQMEAIPVEAVFDGDGYYLVPRDGAHRLAILMHLEYNEVLVKVIEIVLDPKTRSPGYAVDGERSFIFNNVNQEALEYAKQVAEQQSLHRRKFT